MIDKKIWRVIWTGIGLHTEYLWFTKKEPAHLNNSLVNRTTLFITLGAFAKSNYGQKFCRYQLSSLEPIVTITMLLRNAPQIAHVYLHNVC